MRAFCAYNLDTAWALAHYTPYTHPGVRFGQTTALSRQIGESRMFRKSFGFASRSGVAAMALTALLSTAAFAQAPVTGLGQSWPNAADVSVSPHYHVYVFVRDGIRYIQVNDLNGTVRAAVAVADDVVLVLPVGADAQSVTTRHGLAQLAGTQNTGAAETVYSDRSTRITATPTSTGALQVNVATTPVIAPAICTSPGNCGNLN